jgi:hypothetical protein
MRKGKDPDPEQDTGGPKIYRSRKNTDKITVFLNTKLEKCFVTSICCKTYTIYWHFGRATETERYRTIQNGNDIRDLDRVIDTKKLYCE